MALDLLGNQVFFGDVPLFLPGVAAHLNDLHPVKEGSWDVGNIVGGGDEQHLAQIERHFQVMVPEGVVLLRVQHLQHGGGGVAPEVVAHFVDFVQQNQRVPAAGLAHGFHDPAGHGAQIGFPVAPDIRLVPDAAQGNPDVFPAQGFGDGFGYGGFAHAGRPRQADDLPLDVGGQLPDGNQL